MQREGVLKKLLLQQYAATSWMRVLGILAEKGVAREIKMRQKKIINCSS